MAGTYTHNGKILMNIKNGASPQCYANPSSTEYGGGGFAMKAMDGAVFYPFSLSWMASRNNDSDEWDKAGALLFDTTIACTAPWRTIKAAINSVKDTLKRNVSGVCFSSNTDAPSEDTFAPVDIVSVRYETRFTGEDGSLNFVFTNTSESEVTINKIYFCHGAQYVMNTLNASVVYEPLRTFVFYEELLDTPLIVPSGSNFAVSLKPHLAY